MSWYPLINLTHYSLLKGFSKPKELAKKCANNNYSACGIADYKSISGCVSFYQACKSVGIKPILGCSFDDYSIFAKNKKGWFELIEMISTISSDEDIDVDIKNEILKRGNLISISKQEVDDSIKLSYYCDKKDALLHRILLCSELKTTLPKQKNQTNKCFFSDEYYVLNKDESKLLKTTLLEKINDECEEYDILSKPMLPKFDCPDGLSEEEYLKVLARTGWKELLIKTGKVKDPIKKQIYADRFNTELQVIKEANLFGYFLIVQDIIGHVNKSGWMSGPGRGSAAGCLISYLIGVTQIDPVEYDLLFERFYNAGRNSADHISLPDIDMDVPAKRRDDVILYLKNKYGHDHVSQMITFGRLQGRSAIKEVLRINEACSFSEMNAITKSVPNEAEISDQLAEMDEEDRSIIRWSLINRPDDLRDFCQINEYGKLEGDYAEYFQQAIEIEGTFKTQGKHAAGVVISKEPLNKVCPMVKQKGSEEKVAGLEMSDLEALGHVKFDILGLSLLDKLMYINETKLEK